MPRENLTLSLTERQAEALHALASLEDLPPEIYAAEVLVATRVILHQVARDQDRIAYREMTGGVSKGPLQRLEGIHAAQRAFDVAE